MNRFGSWAPGLGFVAPVAYPLEPERVLIRDFKYPQYKNAVQEGVVFERAGEPYPFRYAVQAGFVPDSAEGYETVSAYVGNPAVRADAGLAALIRDYYAAANDIDAAYRAKYGADPMRLVKFLSAGNAFPLDEFQHLIAGAADRISGTGGAPATVVQTATEFLGRSAPGSFTAPVYPLVQLLARRTREVYDRQLPEGGNTRFTAWEPLPRPWWVREPGLFLALDVPALGLIGWRPYDVALRETAFPVPAVVQQWHDTLPAGWNLAGTILRDEQDAAAYLTAGWPGWQPPVSWQAPLAEVSAPAPVPFPAPTPGASGPAPVPTGPLPTAPPPPGVPPTVTPTGQLVTPLLVGGGINFGADDVTQAPPVTGGPTPADALPALGGGLGLLAVAGLLWYVARRRGGR